MIVDLPDTTTNAVRDLEDLRRWLGLGKINIYGLSYGTRVALAYMKMFPSSIASCILWSPLPTYARMPLYFARDAQQTLDRLFADCKNDPSCNGAFPALAGEFEALKNRWKAGPMRVSRPEASGQSRELSIPWDAFQTKIRSLLYAPAGLRQVPYLVHQAFIGNLEPFIALYPSGPDTSQFLAEGFYLCVTCTEAEAVQLLIRLVTNRGMSFSGYWRGPYWFEDRVTITGRSVEAWWERAIRSLAAFDAE